MDTIAEIRRHLSIAEGDQKTVSGHRWEAARLIWETVMAGQSRREIAEQVGKSHTHINLMYKCWDLAGRQFTTSSPENLPDFNAIYHSAEIRDSQRTEPGRRRPGGDSDAGDELIGAERNRHPREAPEPDNTAHGRVVAADRALRSLAENDGLDIGLSEDDAGTLRAMIPLIRRILARRGSLASDCALSFS